MDDGFNPYSEWLAIESAQRPDHYVLLGLACFEADPQRVVTAADQRIAQLRKAADKERLGLAKRVAQEIIAARNCLLSATERATYDGQLRGTNAVPRTASAGLVLPPRAFEDDDLDEMEAPLEGIALPPALMATALPPTALVASPPVVEAPAAAEPPLPDDRVVVQRQPTAPRRPPVAKLALIVASAAIGLTGISAAVFIPQWLRPPVSTVAGPVDAAGDNDASAVAATTHDAVTETPVGPSTEVAASTAVPPSEVTDPTPAPTDAPSESADVAMEGPTSEEPAMAELPDTAMNANETSPPDAPDPNAGSTEIAANLDATKVTLAVARKAMSKGDMEAAADQVDLADLEALDTQAAEFVAHDRAVLEFLKGFWLAVDEGFRQLSAGAEFEWDGRTVVVVERTPQRLIIRSSGRNLRYERTRLPPKLSLFLANRWLKPDDANTPLFVAAFHLFDGDGDRAEAQRLLEAARSAGTEVAADLIAELDAGKTATP